MEEAADADDNGGKGILLRPHWCLSDSLPHGIQNHKLIGLIKLIDSVSQYLRSTASRLEEGAVVRGCGGHFKKGNATYAKANLFT